MHNSSFQAEFSWSKPAQANLLSGFFYGSAVTQIAGGYVADKYGARPALLTGMALMSISSLAVPFMARYVSDRYFERFQTDISFLIAYRVEYWFVLTLRVFQGMLTGFILPTIFSIFTSWSTPEEKGTLMSITYSGMSLANILTYPVSSMLCSSGIDGGWPMVFYGPGKSSFRVLLPMLEPQNH